MLSNNQVDSFSFSFCFCMVPKSGGCAVRVEKKREGFKKFPIIKVGPDQKRSGTTALGGPGGIIQFREEAHNLNIHEEPCPGSDL